jgi:serine/threonine-protein kinase
LEQVGSTPWVIALWTARAHRLRAHHDFALGRNPRPSLEAALEVLHTAGGDPPRDSWLLEELLLTRVLEAEHERRQGRDAASALEKARTTVRTLGEVDRRRAGEACQVANHLSPLLAPECQRLSSQPQRPLR